MINYLRNSLVVEAAGRIVGLWTDRAIVTGSRI